ncbi:MAG: hypothetical protein HONBIEJF_02103 [Fimbriimonadaceae bacterium]|nr:hypothetical protein [Fimbriimonadaceae bacterium]
MAALTAPYEAFERPGIVIAYKMSNVKIYKGSMVGINSLGFVIPMTHATANLKYVGVANETVDNSTGSSGDKLINVTKNGSFVVKASSFTPSLANLGSEVYILSDWEVQINATGLTNSYKAGTIVAVENTSGGVSGVRIRIENHTL